MDTFTDLNVIVMTTSTENKYAVVGAGGVFPGASNLEQFWANLLEKRVSIQRIPDESVEREVFFRPETLGKKDKQDRTYTDLFAPVGTMSFDAHKFRIPPAVAVHMDDNQKLSLVATEEALTLGGLEGVNRDRVSVHMGSTMIGQSHHANVTRFDYEKFAYYLKRHPIFSNTLTAQNQERLLAEVRARVVSRPVCVTEDTAPGVLPNIIAARINSVFDLHGHAYTVDAACASGLAAIICGIQQLRLRECDAVICGAADIQNEEVGRIYFSGIGALSAEGSFPFDERASGFVIGDGGGVVVLQRLEDAIRAGRKILAVVTGYGQASDGRGKAIAAPNEQWQANTIFRAWNMAGVPADTIELIEAHGTSTQVGDLSEVNALKRSFRELAATRTGFCGLGSVKSNIGHLKSAAGIAGFLKAVLALDHKVLPATAGFSKENPKLQLTGSPFYILSETREWAESEHPRRAGVSAFGFGGADYHLALEEFRAADYPQLAASGSSSHGRTRVPATGSDDLPSERVALNPMQRTAAVTTADRAGCSQPLFFSADSVRELLQLIETFRSALARGETSSDTLVTLQNASARCTSPIRLALKLGSAEEFSVLAENIAQFIEQSDAATVLQARGIALGVAAPLSNAQVAALFPGQGSQYPDMLLDFFERYPSAKQFMARADTLWRFHSQVGVTDMIRSTERGEAATERLLRQTQNTHPALVFSSLAIFRVLEEMGLRPAVMVGHSVGEFAALTAARRLTFADAVQLVHARATAFSKVPSDEAGAMVAVPLPAEKAEQLLEQLECPLVVANVNSPNQTIVSGSESAVVEFLEVCKSRRINAVRLNVSHAFHSPLMEPAEAHFQETLRNTRFRDSSVRVIANSTNEYYGPGASDVQQVLATQITGSVRFSESIQRLYRDNIRVFVEVGPGNVLSSLARNILAGTDATVLASDQKRGNTNDAFVGLVCRLFALGIEVDPSLSAVVDTSTQTAVSSHERDSEAQTFERGSGGGSYKSPGLVNPDEYLTLIPPVIRELPTVVYGGVAVGLPGSFKQSFRDDNFEQLFSGNNLIERLSDVERQRLVDLHISKVVKSEQGASFASLTTLEQVIQLAGKIGRLDLAEDYRIDPKDVANMSTAIAHAVAVGFEALRDAHIPLVHEYTRTAGGSLLPERWALPKEMQRHTGVIFANGFPMVDPIIREVSRHLAYRFGHELREELFEFYDTLLEQVSDRASRKVLSDWYALNCSRLRALPSEDEIYTFNHHLMTQISMQANNRLARLVNARGPNFQMNAACSSTATAVTLAEDLIRSGRAKRMIIIGGDDPTSRDALPYLGAGFLATGACTNSADLYEAAIPFDRRRNGMIMGAGAVGIVIELESECERRGVVPVCELLGTHSFNTAGHSSQLDVPRYAEELDNFVSRMEARHGFNRQTIARQLVYVSHETYTPPRGGCSESEAVALRHVFGDALAHIEISNTKGMTGHTMGASIEDAVAAKALQFGRAAPVVNFKEPDPALAGLKLSRGEPRDFAYALRMAAGFGSQGNYILLKRRARAAERIMDNGTHLQWLRSVSSLERPELNHMGRLLVVKDAKPGSILVDRPDVDACSARRPESVRVPPNPVPTFPGTVATPSLSSPLPATTSTSSQHDVKQLVLSTVAEVTGYPIEILELDMDLEADLGVDTVKQATILAGIAEQLGLSDGNPLRLSECSTLRRVIELYQGSLTQVAPASIPSPALAEAAVSGADSELEKRVFEVISQVTGYATDILDPQMELESDLGIDTVKQATVLAILAEHLNLPQEAGLRMSEFSTVAQLVALIGRARGKAPSSSGENGNSSVCLPPKPSRIATDLRTNSADVSNTAAEPNLNAERRRMTRDAVLDELFDAIQTVTQYPRELLDAGLRLETDLEFTVTNRGALRTALAARFALSPDWEFPPDTTLGTLTDLLFQRCEDPSPSASLARPAEEPSQKLARQVLALREAPEIESSSLSLSQSSVCIIGDDPRRLERVSERFKALGASVYTVLTPESGSPNELGGAIDELLTRQRPDVIVDVASHGLNGEIRELPPETVMPAINRAADCRFTILKRFDEAGYWPRRLLAVVELGGQYALTGSDDSAAALYGIQLGLYKAIRKEWLEHTHVTILDLPASAWAEDAQQAWHLIQRELTASGDGVEICYIDQRRHRLVSVDSYVEDRNTEVDDHLDDEVVIATGGGSGITAEIVLEFARRKKCRFALIGRTQLDPGARGKRFTDDAQRAAEKHAIQRRLTAEGRTVTPRLIEAELTRAERSAEVLDTIGELERLGSSVRYIQADVCDRDALRDAVRETHEHFGPITMLILGAGLEVSHRMKQKSVEEFHRVHAPKTIGTHLIRWLCRDEPLRRVLALSSISGRFGNAGQIDYSAANSFLDLTARIEPSHGPRSQSLAWSGWCGLGMAWRNGFVRDHAESSGLNFIEPRAGAKAAVREILSPKAVAEVLIHRGLGGVADREQLETSVQGLPLVDWIDRRDGKVIRAHRRVSIRRDALLEQHRFAGVPLMPGVGFMEMMAEVASVVQGRADGAIIWTQLAFLDAFKLYREEPRDVCVEVGVPDSEGAIPMTVYAPFVVAGGPSENRPYARARVQIAQDAPMPPFDDSLRLEWTRETDFATELGRAKSITKNVHFGPLFNEACQPGHRMPTRVRLGKQGIETIVPLPRACTETPNYPLDQYLINPAFMDSLHQAGAVLAIELTGHVYLPVSAERFVLYAPLRQPGNYRVLAKLRHIDDESAAYDLIMVRQDHTLCAAITNSCFRRINT